MLGRVVTIVLVLATSAHAQVLFVDRFEPPLDLSAWNLSGWQSANGTYTYRGGDDAGIVFSKTDAGTRALISPAFIFHQLPANEISAFLRYWFRYRRGVGQLGTSPMQTHRQPMYGTLAELTLFANGPVATVSLSCPTASGVRRAPLSVPISPDAWHLMQVDIGDAGSASGTASYIIDGQRIDTMTDLDWSGSSVFRLFAGFGAVADTWIGEIEVDDVLLLSERRAAVMEISLQVDAGIDLCTPFTVTFRDAFDGGEVAPPNVSPIFASIADGGIFNNATCTVMWASTGRIIDTSSLVAYAQVSEPGLHDMTLRSPDLMPTTVAVSFSEPFIDAGPIDAGTPDAGAPDAGAPDAGTIDAGSPDAGIIIIGMTEADGGLSFNAEQRRLDIGCSCNTAPGSLFVLLALLLRRARASRASAAS